MAKTPETEFLKRCREDRDRMRETIDMIDAGIIGQSYKPEGGEIVDLTADYRASIAKNLADLEYLISKFETDDA